MNRRLKRAL